MRSSSNLLNWLLAISLLIIYQHPITVNAKLDSGKVHLSGVKSESTLVKFAISSSSTAKIDVNFTSYGMYENEQELRLRIYIDDDWKKYKKLTLCSEKIKLAQRAIPIIFDYKGSMPDDRKGKKKKKSTVEMYTARVQHEIMNPPNLRRSVKKDRRRYFYFVVDDCSLERFQHDAQIPDMLYDLSILNGRPKGTGKLHWEHLPADEDTVGYLLVLTIISSGLLAMLLFYRLARSVGGEVHVAIGKLSLSCDIYLSCELLF